MADAPDEFIKTTLPLPPGHGWQCKPGNNLFIADRGAVAFETPAKWVVRYENKTLSIHDQDPPDDQCRISLTIYRLPPVRGGWKKLPLEKMMADVDRMEKKSKKRPPSELHIERRPDMDLVWADKGTYKDPLNGRPIRCRQILARARLVQCLITFEVYDENAEDFRPAWNDLLATLQLAVPRDITGQVGN